MKAFVTLLAILVASPAIQAQSEGMTVEQAVALALTRNERVLAADARYTAARARVGRGRAEFLPEASLTAAYTRRSYETTREVDGQTFYLQRRHAISPLGSVSLDIFDARAFSALSQAKHARQAERYSASETRRALAFEVADAFMLCLSADRLLEAALRRQTFANRSLADARARFGAQLVSSNDVTRAQLEVATADRQVTRARGDRETASLGLGYLIGEDVAGPLSPPEFFRKHVETLLAGAADMIERAEATRGDVLESRFRVEALKASAHEPITRLLPRLEVSGYYRMTNEGGLEDRTRDWWLGGRLEWDLLDGGRWHAERAERKALARAAELEADALRRRVAVEARTALAELRSARAAVEQARVAAEVAQTNARQTAELYRQGLTGALEVADANVSLFEADVAHVRERYGLTLAVLGLNEALGLDPFSKEPNP